MKRLFLILIAVLVSSIPVKAGIVVFGDSLSDAGNLFLATGGGFPFNGAGPGGVPPSFPTPPYDGKFTNGPTWVESFAAGRGMQVDPSVIGGTNFAFGGAESGNGESARGTPNVGAQIGMFVGSGMSLNPDTLISLWVGANDFNNMPVADPADVVSNIAAHIGNLQSMGGRQFLIPNLPDLGQTPFALALGPDVSAFFTAVTRDFNALLAIELENLRTSLGIRIFEMDVYSEFNTVVANPGAYGFTNTTGTAFDVNAFQTAFLTDPTVDGNLFLVNNPSEYVFLDGVHPTAEFHQILSRAARDATVPEPASLAVWGTAILIGLGVGTRRRNRATGLKPKSETQLV